MGERAAETPGLLSSIAKLVESTGAKFAWIPRRAGEVGALQAGAIGNLLPGGRPVADNAARVDVAATWGVSSLPADKGRSTEAIVAAVNSGEIAGLVLGGVDPYDHSYNSEFISALKKSFVVSLEISQSEVAAFADVILPVASVPEKSGSFLNWEGRARGFEAAVTESLLRSDVRILSMVADAMSKPINLPSVKKASEELAEIGAWNGAAATFTSVPTQSAAAISGNQAVLTSWRRLLDAGSLQEGELNLAGTARSTVAVISPKRASALGVVTGEKITISNECGSITLESLVEEIHDDAVWLPRNSSGSQLLRTLCTASNSVVTVVKA